NLPLEHFMEATPHARQREIFLASFALLKSLLDDLEYFNELLVQYFFKGRLRQVVPDNMLVRGKLPSQERTNYAVELEPLPPFMMLEYVSASSKQKDYKDSFAKYERELKVPYYLLFDLDTHDLLIYRHNGTRYVPLEPGSNGRIRIAELDLE